MDDIIIPGSHADMSARKVVDTYKLAFVPGPSIPYQIHNINTRTVPKYQEVMLIFLQGKLWIPTIGLLFQGPQYLIRYTIYRRTVL